ncbi:hypothetical protein H9P43_003674 [Blastocladiella emersonii ATCC 22665]|nr:hypothetical protein H9P43_003674 [Blastocladiella emersonii ATCC 22665]
MTSTAPGASPPEPASFTDLAAALRATLDASHAWVAAMTLAAPADGADRAPAVARALLNASRTLTAMDLMAETLADLAVTLDAGVLVEQAYAAVPSPPVAGASPVVSTVASPAPPAPPAAVEPEPQREVALESIDDAFPVAAEEPPAAADSADPLPSLDTAAAPIDEPVQPEDPAPESPADAEPERGRSLNRAPTIDTVPASLLSVPVSANQIIAAYDLPSDSLPRTIHEEAGDDDEDAVSLIASPDESPLSRSPVNDNADAVSMESIDSDICFAATPADPVSTDDEHHRAGPILLHPVPKTATVPIPLALDDLMLELRDLDSELDRAVDRALQHPGAAPGLPEPEDPVTAAFFDAPADQLAPEVEELAERFFTAQRPSRDSAMSSSAFGADIFLTAERDPLPAASETDDDDENDDFQSVSGSLPRVSPNHPSEEHGDEFEPPLVSPTSTVIAPAHPAVPTPAEPVFTASPTNSLARRLNTAAPLPAALDTSMDRFSAADPHSPPSPPNLHHPPLHHHHHPSAASDTPHPDGSLPRATASQTSLLVDVTVPADALGSGSRRATAEAMDEARAVVAAYAAPVAREALRRVTADATMLASAAVGGGAGAKSPPISSPPLQVQQPRPHRASLGESVFADQPHRMSDPALDAAWQAHQHPHAQHAALPPRAASAGPDTGAGVFPPPPSEWQVHAGGPRSGSPVSGTASTSSARNAASAAAYAARRSVGFVEAVEVVRPPSSGKRRLGPLSALRKIFQGSSGNSSAAHQRSRSASPGTSSSPPPPAAPTTGRDPAPPALRTNPAVARTIASTTDLARSESQISRHIHLAEANMEHNVRLIAQIGAQAAAAAQAGPSGRGPAPVMMPPPRAMTAPPAPVPMAEAGMMSSKPATPRPRVAILDTPQIHEMTPESSLARSSEMLAALPLPVAPHPAVAAAVETMPVAAAAAIEEPGALDRFLPPSAEEAEEQQQQQQQRVRSQSFASGTSAGVPDNDAADAVVVVASPIIEPLPAAKSTASPRATALSMLVGDDASGDDDEDAGDGAELWPLVELSSDRQAALQVRAGTLVRQIARDAIGYYAANEPDERRAHSRRCHAAFLAYRAAPAIQGLHQACMRVTLATLVHALDSVKSAAAGGGKKRPGAVGPAPHLPEIPDPEELARVQRTLLGFVAAYTDSGPPSSTSTPAAGGAPAVAGLAQYLYPARVVAAAYGKFKPPHPVVYRLLDRIAALLVLARLTGLSLLYPAPGAPFAAAAMVRAIPRGMRLAPPEDAGDEVGASLDRAPGGNGEAEEDEDPRVLRDLYGGEATAAGAGDDEEEENVALALARVDRVHQLVFPGLIDAQGRIVAKAQVVVMASA